MLQYQEHHLHVHTTLLRAFLTLQQNVIPAKYFLKSKVSSEALGTQTGALITGNVQTRELRCHKSRPTKLGNLRNISSESTTGNFNKSCLLNGFNYSDQRIISVKNLTVYCYFAAKMCIFLCK